MSINTSNLVTTTNGQSELAKVHSVNYALKRDGREIHVEFLFPYIAISKKSPDEVAIIASSTESEVKSEPCWSNVDICQVQTYSVLETIKRNFTIGVLFDVKEDIEGAKTVILFAKTIIVDNRSKERIDKDSHRSAVDIVLNNYGYETKMLPYAYTTLLDETGNYAEVGIKIGAARFGRSRHRFYFNYIIDNNDGIADNITVDDNVYPYSDSYLSKTAFELGLERYEKAVNEYVAEYNKYANGRNVHYENLEGAITNAVNGHKFYLEQNELEDASFGWLDLKGASSIYGWEEWPKPTLESLDDEIYDGFVPKNFDNYAPHDDANAAKIQRGMLFTDKDIKCVEYTDYLGNVSEKYVSMKLNCLMTVRTSLPPLQRMFTTSLYNFARIVVQLFIKDLGSVNFGFEIQSSQGWDISPTKDLFYIPQMPSIGKIKIKESLVNGKLKLTMSTLIMTNDVSSEIAYYNSSIGDGNGNWFKSFITIRDISVMTGLMEMGIQPAMENLKVSILKRGECYVPNLLGEFVVYPTQDGLPVTNKDVVCTGLSYKLQPNFAGGYGFLLKEGAASHKDFLLSKEFTQEEISSCDSKIFQNEEKTPSTTFVINDISHTLMSYMSEEITGTAPSDWLMFAIDDKKVVKTDLPSEHYLPKAGLIMNLDSKMYYTLISESRLHNARVLIAEKREENTFYRAITSSTELYIVIIANSNVYKLSLTYGKLLGESVTVTNVSNVEIVSFSLRKNVSLEYGESQVFKFGIKVRMGDGTNFTETLITRYLCQSTQGTEESDTPNEVNAQTRPSKYVAVQDISGATNVIKETLSV